MESIRKNLYWKYSCQWLLNENLSICDRDKAGIGNGSHSFAYNTNLYQIYGAGSYTVEVYAITNCGNYNPMIENSPLNAYISQNNLNSLRYVKEDAGKFLILKDDVIIQEE